MAKPKKCPKCGGSARGRGYAHKASCDKATQKRRAKSKRAKSSEASPLDGRSLRKMDVGDLLALRDKVDNAISSKAPEIKAKIADMQKTLKTIQGK